MANKALKYYFRVDIIRRLYVIIPSYKIKRGVQSGCRLAAIRVMKLLNHMRK